jgi:hypothetical protein
VKATPPPDPPKPSGGPENNPSPELQATLSSALPDDARAALEEGVRKRAEAKAIAARDAVSEASVDPKVTPKSPSTPPIATTLIGGTGKSGPPPIIPRRRTPHAGLPAQGSGGAGPTLLGGIAAVTGLGAPGAPRKITPAAGTPSPLIISKASVPPMSVSADGGAMPTDAEADQAMARHARPVVDLVPPAIRIPQGGMLGSSAPAASSRKGSLLCEVLLRNGAVTQENIDRAIAIQEERGGQIGRILVSLGACSEEAIARALIDQLKVRKNTGYVADVSLAARENKDVAGLKVLTKPTYTVLTLLFTDIFSLMLAALVATAVHWARTYSDLGTTDWTSWLVVGPSIALCLLTYLGL